MQISEFLPILLDVAQTFLSILDLLLTRIIPVFAILIVSVVVRISHLIASLAAGSSSSKPTCNGSSSKDAAAERFSDTEQEYDDLSVQSDDGIIHSANEDDDRSYLEDWVPVQNDSFSPGNSPVSEDYEEGSGSWQEGGPRNRKVSLSNSPPLEFLDTGLVDPSNSPGSIALLNSSDNDSVDSEFIYPSDLPASLDHVERSVEADLHTPRHRILPPSLSQVEKALREMSGPGLLRENSQEAVDNPTKQPGSPTLAKSRSEARFLARFRRHFLLDK